MGEVNWGGQCPAAWRDRSLESPVRRPLVELAGGVDCLRRASSGFQTWGELGPSDLAGCATARAAGDGEGSSTRERARICLAPRGRRRRSGSPAEEGGPHERGRGGVPDPTRGEDRGEPGPWSPQPPGFSRGTFRVQIPCHSHVSFRVRARRVEGFPLHLACRGSAIVPPPTIETSPSWFRASCDTSMM